MRGPPSIRTPEGPGEPEKPTVERWSRDIPPVTYDFSSCNAGTHVELQTMKASLSHQLTKTAPYVTVEWDDGTQGRAMVDTGADWSLVSDEELTPVRSSPFVPPMSGGEG